MEKGLPTLVTSLPVDLPSVCRPRGNNDPARLWTRVDSGYLGRKSYVPLPRDRSDPYRGWGPEGRVGG